jgi:hypothetical protein
MYALLVSLEIDASRMPEVVQFLDGFAVPAISRGEGFVNGTWMRALDGASGRSILLYETREAAEAAAARASEGPPPGAPIRFGSAEVFEVLRQA